MLLSTFAYKSLCGHMRSFLLYEQIGVELLGHMGCPSLTIWETAKVTAPFHIPTSNKWEFQFSHILPNTCYCQTYRSYTSGCEVVSYSDFNLHFPNDEWCLFFLCLFIIQISSMEMSIHILCYLNYLKHLFWSSYWFTGSCKNSTEKTGGF